MTKFQLEQLICNKLIQMVVNNMDVSVIASINSEWEMELEVEGYRGDKNCWSLYLQPLNYNNIRDSRWHSVSYFQYNQNFKSYLYQGDGYTNKRYINKQQIYENSRAHFFDTLFTFVSMKQVTLSFNELLIETV